MQRAIADAAGIAEREGITLAAAEAELRTALLALGRAVLALFLARAAPARGVLGCALLAPTLISLAQPQQGAQDVKASA